MVFSSLRRKGPLAQKVREVPDAAVDRATAPPGEIGSTAFLAHRAEDLSTRSMGAAAGPAGVPERVQISSATYAALSPVGDATVLETVTSGARPHIFAAVMSSQPAAHGGDFLRRNLHRELQAQVTACRGNVPNAFKATLAHLDLKYRALHINNAHVLDGTHVAAAYVDFATSTIHIASNDGCLAVVGTSDALGRAEVAVELGRLGSGEVLKSGGRLTDEHITSLPLDGNVESIVLGSTGLWHELPAYQAALRVAIISGCAPHATGGNLAANLTQLALQAVAVRSAQSKDPRMAVLRDTATLQQLWTGSKRNYKWGGRQPLRRRRGDVHGDLSAVVIRFDWPGTESLPRSSLACKKMCALAGVSGGNGSRKGLPRSASGASIASTPSFSSLRAAGRASHWDLVRAHFGLFRPAAAAAARARWYAAVDAALAEARATVAASAAAAAAATAPPPLQQRQDQTAAPQPATQQLASKAEPAIAIQAIATAQPNRDRRGSYTIPEEEWQSPAEAAAAEAKAARRRASGLATTSYRRLGSMRHERADSLNSTALQQMSVY